MKHGRQVQLSRKQTQLKICPNVNLSAISTDPSVTLKQKDFRRVCCNLENTCPSIPQGQHMSKPQIRRSFQKRPPSPSPLCSAGRARYATSPQSDAAGRPEDNASGGRVLQAQMAKRNSATSRHVLALSPSVSLQFKL